mgnify:CR=1 FL=1
MSLTNVYRLAHLFHTCNAQAEVIILHTHTHVMTKSLRWQLFPLEKGSKTLKYSKNFYLVLYSVYGAFRHAGLYFELTILPEGVSVNFFIQTHDGVYQISLKYATSIGLNNLKDAKFSHAHVLSNQYICNSHKDFPSCDPMSCAICFYGYCLVFQIFTPSNQALVGHIRLWFLTFVTRLCLQLYPRRHCLCFGWINAMYFCNQYIGFLL